MRLGKVEAMAMVGRRLNPSRSLRGAFLSACSIGLAGALVACESLSDTTAVPDGTPLSFDGGIVGQVQDAGGSSTPTGETPTSGRIRLVNLLRGGGSIDVCARQDGSGTSWIGNLVGDVQPHAKPGGLRSGEVSGHKFLNAASGREGTRYQFRVIAAGAACDSPDSPAIASISATAIRQGGGLTLVAYGDASGGDAGDANPRAVAIADEVTPTSTAARVRIFHAIPDMAAFDLVIDGEIVASGVKYGSASAYPYSSTSGFVSLAAGVPENATLTLRAGTNVRTFTVPNRVRRGVAMTFLASGSASAPVVSLCSDRSPPESATLADCTRLNESGP